MSRTRAAWILLAPFLVGFVAFTCVPFVIALVQSFVGLHRDTTYGAASAVFAGLDNYRAALANSDFLTGFGTVLKFGLVQIPVMLIGGLTLALLLDSGPVTRLVRTFRLVYFVPYAVPGVVAALLWGFFYDRSSSPINQILDPIGISVDLLSADWLIYALANIVTWTFTGYNMLIMYSALQAIPPTLYEAAEIDGASAWSVAWHIKVPIIGPAILLTALFSLIGTFQLFVEPTVLRPLSQTINSGYTPVMSAYNQISTQNFGLGAAMSVIITALIGALSFALFRFTQKRVAT